MIGRQPLTTHRGLFGARRNRAALVALSLALVAFTTGCDEGTTAGITDTAAPGPDTVIDTGPAVPDTMAPDAVDDLNGPIEDNGSAGPDGASPDAVADSAPDVVWDTPDGMPVEDHGGTWDTAPDIIPIEDNGPGDTKPDDGSGESCTSDAACDYGSPCVKATCDNGTCTHTPLPGLACNDNSLCTTEDVCNALGVCTGTPKDCGGDGDSCTHYTCDSGTGECGTILSGDDTPCSDPAGTCGAASCQNGMCLCECTDDLVLSLDLVGGSSADMSGCFVINSQGTATDEQGNPLAPLGPLMCASEWLDGSSFAPQVSGRPLEIEWTRPCKSFDLFTFAHVDYLEAGGTYWAAEYAGALQSATLKVNNLSSGDSVATKNLFGLHVTHFDPPVGSCVDFETVSLRANVPTNKGIDLEVSGIGTFRVGSVQVTADGSTSPAVNDPYQWDSITIPDGTPVGSVSFNSPCGDLATDAVFGATEIGSWGLSGAQNTSVIFKGVDGAELGRFFMLDAAITYAGNCVAGSRLLEVSAKLAND